MADVFCVIGKGDVSFEARHFYADYVLRVDDAKLIIAVDEALRSMDCHEYSDCVLAVVNAAVSCGTIDGVPASEIYKSSDKLIGVALPFSTIENSRLFAGIYGYVVMRGLFFIDTSTLNVDESDIA